MLTLNVNHFDYDKATKTLSAEASTLEANTTFTGQQIFKVKSNKTGNEVEITYSHKEYDDSQEDVLAFVYKPVDKNAPISQVVIYND